MSVPTAQQRQKYRSDTTRKVSSLCVAAPGGCVLEHAQPGGRCEGGPEVPRGPGPLPAQSAALRVGHHGQVSAVPGAEPCYALWGAVRVQRVLFSGVALVVKVSEGGEPTGNDLVLCLGATELHQTYKGKRLQENEKQTQLLITKHAELWLMSQHNELLLCKPECIILSNLLELSLRIWCRILILKTDTRTSASVWRYKQNCASSHMTATFSVRDPDSQSRSLHAPEPDGWGLLNPDADEPRLKPAGLIMGQHHFIIWRRSNSVMTAFVWIYN